MLLCSAGKSGAKLEEDDQNQPIEEGRRILRVGLICGGPSLERGISLNSARSLLDHIQELLERSKIPFVGTGASECRKAFDKCEASLELGRKGFPTVPSFLVQGASGDESDLLQWFERKQLDVKAGKVVVKPARGGSSIGVSVAYGLADSFQKASQIISELSLLSFDKRKKGIHSLYDG